jgi:hypothetical protein
VKWQAKTVKVAAHTTVTAIAVAAAAAAAAATVRRRKGMIVACSQPQQEMSQGCSRP